MRNNEIFVNARFNPQKNIFFAVEFQNQNH
jgi:hypothetical protein